MNINTNEWVLTSVDMPCDDLEYDYNKSILVSIMLKDGAVIRKARFDNLSKQWDKVGSLSKVKPSDVVAWQTYEKGMKYW